jgi:flagellar motor switch protein FliM
MLEPVRDLLTRPLQDNTMEEVDQRWTHQLSRQVRNADVKLSAEFATVATTIGQLLKMQVNDILPIEIPAVVTAHVGQVPVMECTYGTFNGRYALRVQKMLTNPQTEPIKATHDD